MLSSDIAHHARQSAGGHVYFVVRIGLRMDLASYRKGSKDHRGILFPYVCALFMSLRLRG
jgi:hypothetical protein